MIVKTYWEIEREYNKRYPKLVDRIVENATPYLIKKYSRGEENFSKFYQDAVYQLSLILVVMRGKLDDKDICDLGCGVTYPLEKPAMFQECYRNYEPWLLRILKSGIGIDLGLIDEEFEKHNIDLLKPDCLAFMPSNSLDLVNASFLFNSKLMVFKSSHYDANGAAKSLYENLYPQLNRILKPKGVFMFNMYDSVTQQIEWA